MSISESSCDVIWKQGSITDTEDENEWTNEPLVDESLFPNDVDQIEDLEDPLAIPSNLKTVKVELESGRCGFVDALPLSPVVSLAGLTEGPGTLDDENSSVEPGPPLPEQCPSEEENHGDRGGVRDTCVEYSVYAHLFDPISREETVQARRMNDVSPWNIQSHTLSAQNSFKCPKCPKVFSRMYSLKRHIRSTACLKLMAQPVDAVSSRVRSFQCDLCDRTFDRKQRLEFHRRSHLVRSNQLSNSRILRDKSQGWSDSVVAASIPGGNFASVHVVEHTIKQENEGLVDGVPGVSGESGSGNAVYGGPTNQGFTANSIDKMNLLVGCELIRAVEGQRNPSSDVPDTPVGHRYECAICEKTFRDRPNLASHMHTHTDERPFKCGMCANTFRKLWTLSRHKRLHEEIGFNCDFCSKKFSTKQRVLDHMAITHNVVHKCELCTRTFGCHKYLEEHIEKYHSKQNAAQHTVTHSHEIAGLTEFSKKRTLQTEKASHMPVMSNAIKMENMSGAGADRSEKEPVQSTCTITSEAHSTFVELPLKTNDQSVVLGLDISENQDSCPETFCDDILSYSYISDSTNQNSPDANIPHRRGGHEDPETEHSVTEVSIQQKEAVRAEIRPKCRVFDHTNVQNVELSERDDSLLRAPRLKDTGVASSSRRKRDRGNQVYRCDQCNRTFSLKCNLKTHLLSHANERPHKCDECGAAFEHKSGIAAHMVIHSHLKPYKCMQCTGAFKRKFQLDKHIFNRHGKIQKDGSSDPRKPTFNCNKCQATFRLKISLLKHMLVHSSLKLRQCDQCPMAFKRKGEFDRHIARHHCEKSFNCEVCPEVFTEKYKLRIHMFAHNRTLSLALPSETYRISTEEPNEVCLSIPTTEKKLELSEQNRSTSSQASQESGGDITSNACVANTKPEYYKCGMCQAAFIQKQSLAQHMVVHSDLRPYNCVRCAQTFKRKGELSRHSFRHHSELYTCGVCGRTFDRRYQLTLHTNTHKRQKPFKCTMCSEVFAANFKLRNHMFSHNGAHLSPSGTGHKCNQCPRVYRRPAFLLKHIQTHTSQANEKPYLCDRCPKMFRDKRSLGYHMPVHTGEKPFECDVCKKTFARKMEVAFHMVVHSDEKPFECDICHKLFRTKQNFRRHMVRHTGVGPHKCVACGKMFARLNQLTEHMLLHTNEKPYECDVCHIRFARLYSLRCHLFKHTGRPFECDTCKDTFVHKSQLAKHIARQACFRLKRGQGENVVYDVEQTGEGCYKCNHCNKLYASKKDLRGHIVNTHPEEKRFKCDRCGRAFKRKSHLIQHLILHNEEKPFKCELCPKTFKRKTEVASHMPTHTGEKNFVCGQCQHAFARKFQLALHMKSHAV